MSPKIPGLKKISKFSPTYIYWWLMRQSGSPDTIARSVALGIFAGFAIPFGGQLIACFLLAYPLKAKPILAFACTWVTNYLTIPFIYPAMCYFGSLLLGNPLRYSRIEDSWRGFFEEPSFTNFFDTITGMGSEILVPFFLGSFVVGIVASAIAYFSIFGMIQDYRRRRTLRLNRKLAATAKKALEKKGA